MTILSQVPHLRMSGFLLSASFPPKPHAEADIKITVNPLTRLIEKKRVGRGSVNGELERGGREKEKRVDV